MSTWASRRKAVYFWAVVLTLTAVSFSIFWKFWYRAPSCFDGLPNGDETGVDCGGSCSLVCSLQAENPVTRSDPRVFRVMDNIYSVLAFVENHNVGFEAHYVPYKFKIFDEKNKLLYEREGATVFAKNKTIAIFEGNMLITRGIPKRAEIELPKTIHWLKITREEPEVEIQSSPILKQDTSPRIEATVLNKSIENLKNIELVAVVFDGRDNAVAASRTFINRLDKNQKTDIFFTWPRPFDLNTRACTKLSEIVLAIDRSGSMQSQGVDPPEPLTSVKEAATFFVSELNDADRAGLVSFATDASNPVDSFLTSDFTSLKTSIGNINIKQNGTQFTNIADAISKSFDLLGTNKETTNAQKIIILLTDGVATRPISPNSKTEAEEIAYAENEALKIAKVTKENEVIIYTIGLGKNIHKDFLRQIATAPENFLEAPSTSTLRSVYGKISSSICKELPARIEITYKILNVRN
jgi:Mg-chelatase subunit ChlD